MRRAFSIGLALLLLAISTEPAAAVDPAATTEDARETAILNRLADEAAGDTLALVIHGIEGHEAVVRAFQRLYPRVNVQVTVQNPSTMGPRIVNEQRAGLYLWDSWWAGTTAMTTIVEPAGGFEPIPPFIEIPSILNPDTWRAPHYMYTSSAGPYVFVASMSVESSVFFNSSVLKGFQFHSERDLLDPRLRGKIAMRDLGGGTTGASYMLASLLQSEGPDFVRRLLLQQRPALYQNSRQITDAIVRGDYAVVMGASPDILLECKSLGGCKSVSTLTYGQSVLSRGVGILKNPPHPRAVRLWINWLLSKQGQEVYVREWAKYQTTGASSLRKDVAPDPGHLSTIPDYGHLDRYGLYGYAVDQPEMQQANALFEELRGQLAEPVPTSAWVVIALTLFGLLILAVQSLRRSLRRSRLRARLLESCPPSTA